MTEDEYIEKTVDCIERLRKQYPDSAYERIVKEICQERLVRYDKHIAKKRSGYNRIPSFKEKKKYYDTTLASRERGYALAKEHIQNYLSNNKPRSYEAWVLPPVYDLMKIRGYKATIEAYLFMIIT